ncbi:MAG: EAL domain-containing protein [Candidatus Weimeria sp.]
MADSKNAELEKYIAAYVDEAIEQGWIKVYFQPVVRALTGRLSSCEALTRWVDPVYGTISPGVFIPVLEKTEQIQKVDDYVIDYVAKLIKAVSEEGRTLVPVSFNLSRVDFSQDDPYEVTENVVAKYGIDRRLLKVEITESTLISDPEKLKRMFTLFHNKGYDIWMDDFGSGYSTLNVLKDYSFDEIKIDMMFLRGLNDRGRNIISSVVRMAKSLNIQTLTEGAETREQVEFLRNIGCEKIQGFYFGAPMPYEQLEKHCFYFGLIPETADEARVYDAAGVVDFLEDKPVTLIDSIDGEISILFSNERARKSMSFFGIRDRQPLISNATGDKNYELFTKLNNFLKSLKTPDVEKTFNAVFKGHYFRTYIRLLKKVNGHCLYQAAVYDITYDVSQNENKRFNDLLREANDIYNNIFLWSPKEDRVEVVSGDASSENAGSSYPNAKNFFKKTADERVAEDDRKRFVDFLNPSHIKAVMNRTHSNFAADVFMFKKPEGGSVWEEIDVMSLKYGDYGDFLILEKKAALEDATNPKAVIERIGSSMNNNGLNDESHGMGQIYHDLLDYSGLKFFWKDKHRRFLGVSNAMLKYYGIKSASEIIGKTDEEMGWHIDNGPYFDDEIQVIREGKTVIKSLGHTLVGGQVKIISATKFPLYDGDEIVGLAGFFEEENTVSDYSEKGVLTDKTTGFMNYGGFMLSLIYYRDNYLKTKESYAVAYIHVDAGHKDNVSPKNKTRLVKQLAESLKENFTVSEMICAMDDHQSFIVVTKESVAVVREHIEAFIADVESISDMESVSENPSVSYSLVTADENIPMDELVAVLKERCRLESVSEFSPGADRFVIELEKLDNMDERIYICDMDSYDLLFLNKMAIKDLGLPEDFSCYGHKCYEVIHHYDHPCNHCTNPVCTRDGFVSHHYHNVVTGHDYLMRDTIISYAGKAAKLSMSVSLTDNIRDVVDKNNLLYKRIRINDFLADALEETDPDEGLDRLLESIGKEFDADRAYIFEEENERLYNTYEWCDDGVEPEKDVLQNMPLSDGAVFYDEFVKNSSFIINDIEVYRGTDLYNILKPQKINRLIAAPLKEKGRISGFIGIDNPSADMMNNADLALNSLTKFISAIIRTRDILNTLNDLSHHDPMTGAYNRSSLKHMFSKLDDSAVTVLVYADINNLKETNDKFGHKAGDNLIIKAVDAMTKAAGTDKVFRMGGDEFVILLESDSMNEIDSRLDALNAAFEKEGISIAMGASVRSDSEDSLKKLLSEADQRMYINKKRMHDKNI